MSIIKKLTLMLLASAMLFSCDEKISPPQEDPDKLIELTFYAGPKPVFEQEEEISLLTVLSEDGTSVNWKDGDKVAIFDGKAVREFTATPDENDPSTATLTGKALPAETYTAFYPYSESLNDSSITFSIPETQAATAGCFESGINPSWAQTTAGSMTLNFSNLAALVKFTVKEDFDGISELTLSSNGSGTLSGPMTYTIGTGLAASEGASSSVTLEGNFSAGTYYFLVSPGTLEKGLNISYTTADGKKHAKYSSGAVTFEAGTVTDLGTLSKSDLAEVLTNTAFISKVSGIVPGIGWTVNNDGTVSLTDGNKAAIAAVTALDLSSAYLYDLSGIEHFTGLTSLKCLGNGLTTLDVSGLTDLTELDCSSNRISELDVSGLTKLTKLECYNNNMSKLNVIGLENLTYLDCSMNSGLETLDVSSLTSLEELDCNGDSISELNLSGLTKLAELNCSSNKLSKLDVSTLSLKSLSCSNNNLTALDVSALSELTKLYCYENQMTALDITKNPDLEELSCGSQTSDGTTSQTLELTLTADQLTTFNNDEWSSDNIGVTFNTGSIDASHEGFEDGGSVSW